MKKKLFDILTIPLMGCLCACQPEYTGWLSQKPDLPEEIEKKPVKPTSYEIPVTRPYEVSQEDILKMVGQGLRNYSWKLFKQLYQERKVDDSLTPNLLLAPYHVISKLRQQMDVLDLRAQEQLVGSFGLEVGTPADMKDFCEKVNRINVKGGFFKVSNSGDSPSIWAHWSNTSSLFSAYDTQQGCFHKGDGTGENVDMMYTADTFMHHVFKKYTIAQHNLCNGLRVFFVRPNYNCTVDDVIESFDPSDLVGNELKHMALYFWMPKFSMQDNHDLDINISGKHVEVKQTLDLRFSENGVYNAEQKLWVSKNWKANGDHASDVFRLDRPFLYGIMESFTNTIIYIGCFGG